MFWLWNIYGSDWLKPGRKRINDAQRKNCLFPLLVREVTFPANPQCSICTTVWMHHQSTMRSTETATLWQGKMDESLSWNFPDEVTDRYWTSPRNLLTNNFLSFLLIIFCCRWGIKTLRRDLWPATCNLRVDLTQISQENDRVKVKPSWEESWISTFALCCPNTSFIPCPLQGW
jgi:hypothetical protein